MRSLVPRVTVILIMLLLIVGCDGSIQLSPQTKSICVSGAGFSELRTQHASVVGECVEDEWLDDYGNAQQRTTKGRLLYLVDSTQPKAYFISNSGQTYLFNNCSEATLRDCEIKETIPSE